MLDVLHEFFATSQPSEDLDIGIISAYRGQVKIINEQIQSMIGLARTQHGGCRSMAAQMYLFCKHLHWISMCNQNGRNWTQQRWRTSHASRLPSRKFGSRLSSVSQWPGRRK